MKIGHLLLFFVVVLFPIHNVLYVCEIGVVVGGDACTEAFPIRSASTVIDYLNIIRKI